MVVCVPCSRGGDGAVQLLCQLSPDTLRRYAKPIIGFSDVTALLSAQASVGVQGIHGSMCHAIATYQGNDTVSQALRHMLMGDMPVYHLPPHVLNQQGRAEGILVGGNMSVLHGLAGSDYDPLSLPDIILFLEDTGEGIPPNELDTLFEPHIGITQLMDETAQTIYLSGLEMPICKALVDMLNGSIDIESDPGHGTSIFIAIPI